MELELTVRELPGLPAPRGAHQLAWAYLLDALFADAWQAGAAHLTLTLPHPELLPEVLLRAELSPPRGDATALALLAGPDTTEPGDGPVRIYGLDFGVLAPAALRRIRPPDPAGRRLVQQLWAYTWRARLLGVPMRLANELRRPHLADRAMFSMRQGFASDEPTPAYYRLRGWA